MATAGRILIMPKGKWASEIAYEALDLVSHNGNSWLCKKTALGIEPTEDNIEYWFKFTDNASVDAELEEILKTVAGKADRTELNALAETVAGMSNQTDFEALSKTVEGKADQAALEELSETVEGKADQAALEELDSKLGNSFKYVGKYAISDKKATAIVGNGLYLLFVNQGYGAALGGFAFACVTGYSSGCYAGKVSGGTAFMSEVEITVDPSAKSITVATSTNAGFDVYLYKVV